MTQMQDLLQVGAGDRPPSFTSTDIRKSVEARRRRRWKRRLHLCAVVLVILVGGAGLLANLWFGPRVDVVMSGPAVRGTSSPSRPRGSTRPEARP